MQDGKNPICKVPVQIENIDSNLLITSLFDNNTDVDDDDDGTPVAAGGGRKRSGTSVKKYDDDMMTRRIRAKRSDNK